MASQAEGMKLLIDRINRSVRDKGNVEMVLSLDRIVDHETEAEQAAVLGQALKAWRAAKDGETNKIE